MAPEVTPARQLVANYIDNRSVIVGKDLISTSKSFHQIIDELREWFDRISPIGLDQFINLDFETKRARGITRDQVPHFRETFIRFCVMAVAEMLEKNAASPVPSKKR